MAQVNLKESKLRLEYGGEINEKGVQKIIAKTYGNIRLNASADDLHVVAQAIASLSSRPLLNVEKSDNFDIL
ncbi:hypothetical protein Q75_05195 [Bacillus coahuilensis p1.1.43]|uniref:DUF1659 domain-containing protein n=1 Tax=Bacillus coahuilensis p1.1.43 TaxID=1150625 RepID=A0A147KA99_9BACI|nr:DUF1659 domain-containing protein [Bacillus coahuilensis]KUP07624.1 hypothetical protein Q75_05195 [Bacillus coahuilensis p1.1.43]